MASTEVEIRDNRALRRVEAIDGDGEVAGYADYQISVDGKTFDFTHTEIDDRFAGQGLGTRIAGGVVEFARSEDVKIIPTCAFLRHYLDKHEETQDVRAEEESAADEQDDDEDSGEDDTEAEDSPESGPADAKAAGAGGSAEEEPEQS